MDNRVEEAERKLKNKKTILVIFAIAFLFGAIYFMSTSNEENKVKTLENYHGYVIEDKQGEFVSMGDMSTVYKVFISKDGEVIDIFTTKNSYDKWNIGDTIK